MMTVRLMVFVEDYDVCVSNRDVEDDRKSSSNNSDVGSDADSDDGECGDKSDRESLMG